MLAGEPEQKTNKQGGKGGIPGRQQDDKRLGLNLVRESTAPRVGERERGEGGVIEKGTRRMTEKGTKGERLVMGLYGVDGLPTQIW